MQFSIEPISPPDHLEVVALAALPPAWFTAAGVKSLAIDLSFQQGYVARAGDVLAGFVTFYVYQGIGHCAWLGVLPKYHRHGIGRRLISALERRVLEAGIAELRVETLGESVEYEPYERTRAFYLALGFVCHKRELLDNPECPELLILSKQLDGAGRRL